VLPDKKLSKKERKSNPEFVELGKFHCFTSGFLSRDIFFSATALFQVLTVAPRTALTVSSVIRDPRNHHIRFYAQWKAATLPGRYSITVK
jgi:hypothetical protein